MGQRIGGILAISVDGQVYNVKATSSTYNPGVNKKEAVLGVSSVHGYKEMAQVPYIETAFSDNQDLDVVALFNSSDVDVQISLSNGKGFVLRGAWYAGEGDITTEEGEIAMRFEGLSGFEV